MNNKDLEDKSNNDILFEIKKMQVEHEALKSKMLNDFERLEEIEKRFATANEILVRRLKGNNQ